MARATIASIALLIGCRAAVGLKANVLAEAQPRECWAAERQNATEVFAQDFTKNYRSKVIELFKQFENDTMILTVGEKRMAPLFENFVSKYENLLQKERRHHQSIVHVALDKESHEKCQGTPKQSNFLDLMCLDLSGWIPASVLSGSLNKGSCASNFIAWTRPHLLYAAVIGSRNGAVLMDTDVVPYRNIVPLLQKHWFKTQDETVQMMLGKVKSGAASTGLVWARKWSIALLKGWIETASKGEFLNKHSTDQLAFQTMAFRDPKWKNLYSTIPGNLVGTCANKGSWATHYACDAVGLLGRDTGKTIKKKGDWVVGAKKGALVAAAGTLEEEDGSTGASEVDVSVAAMRKANDWAWAQEAGQW